MSQTYWMLFLSLCSIGEKMQRHGVCDGDDRCRLGLLIQEARLSHKDEFKTGRRQTPAAYSASVLINMLPWCRWHLQPHLASLKIWGNQSMWLNTGRHLIRARNQFNPCLSYAVWIFEGSPEYRASSSPGWSGALTRTEIPANHLI